jgi:hypothetical protein
MTCIVETAPRRRLSAKLTTGLALSAILAVGALTASAGAEGRHDHHDRGHRRDDRGRGYSGGYYQAPPVVYGPAFGINIGIR